MARPAGTPADGADETGEEPSDDRALLGAHVAGDPDAFGLLFARHRDRLWAVALRTTGDREEAADALQDAMISAFRRAESYRGESAVTTWLHRIVVNACLDRLRRRQVRAADALPDDLETHAGRGALATSTAGGSPDRATTDPAELVLDDERRALVMDALASLVPDQRAALVLVDMEGFTVDEAAAILDCAPGTVKSRCSRGRARLLPLLSGLRGNPTDDGRVQDRAGGPAGADRRPGAGVEGARPTTPDREDQGGERT